MTFFPDPETADETGLVAVTKDINVALLREAYSRGIFPWSEDPVRWYSPDPRAIFLLDHVHLPRRLQKTLRQQRFRVTFDTAFEAVIAACASGHREDGVWITPGFVRAYTQMHRLGHAHSVEVWRDEVLVGGLYGVQLKGLFAGESMFHLVRDASKIAFAHLVAHLRRIGTLVLDAQVLTEQTARLGAVLVRRADYLRILAVAMQMSTMGECSPWPEGPHHWPKKQDYS
jgi:leucyl/phenylalanyl-tRNA--protein transferase